MTALIALVWGLGLVVILGVSRLSGLWPLKVTVPQLFIIKSIVLSYAGYPLLLFLVFEQRVATGLTDPVLIGSCVAAAAYSIIVPLLVRYAIFDRGPVTVAGGGGFRESRESSVGYWVIVMVLVATVTVVYLQKVPRIALFEAFTSGEAAVARSDMTNNFQGKYHWYSIAFHDIAWLVTLVLYGIARTKATARHWGVFVIALALTGFGLLMTGQKSPMAWFVGTLVLTHFALKPDRRIPAAAAVSLLVVVAGILFGAYVLFKGIGGSDVMDNIVSRVLTGQLAGGYNYQAIFPEQVDFLLGRSMPNPGGLLPFENYSLSTRVMAMVSPGTVDAGVVGSQPTMYWGEAYANFGWWGVGVVPLIVGGTLVAAEKLVSCIRTAEVRAATVVWVSVQLSVFAVSGFSWILFPVTLAIGAAVIALHEFVSRTLASDPPGSYCVGASNCGSGIERGA